MDSVIFTGISGVIGYGRAAGAYRIATEIRQNGFTCQVIDQFKYLSDHQMEQLIDKYVHKNTLIVGFSTTFFSQINDLDTMNPTANRDKLQENRYKDHQSVFPHSDEKMKWFFNLIKKRSPQCKIVVGGARSTYENFDGVDYWIWGEADRSVIELMKHLKGSSVAPQACPVPSGGLRIDSKKSCPYEGFNESVISYSQSDAIFRGEHLPIEISRGCSFNCAFCCYQKRARNEYLKKTSTLRAELLSNFKEFESTGYMFSDDTYNDSLEKVESYHSLFTQLPFDIEFACYARIDMIYAYPQMIKLLYESGMRSVFFGIETLNHKSGISVGKGLSPEKIKEALNRCREEWGDKVVISAGFIAGLPHETEESLQKTMEWLLDKDCPIHFSQFSPLGIFSAKENLINESRMNKDPEKFGYKIIAEKVAGKDLTLKMWENNMGLNFASAVRFVKEFDDNNQTRRARSGMNLVSFTSRLANLGYTHQDILEGTIDGKEIQEKTEKRRNNYIEALLKHSP